MEPHGLGRDVRGGGVEDLDVLLNLPAKFLDSAPTKVNMKAQGEIGRVELKDVSALIDRLVLLSHSIRKDRKVLVLARIELIRKIDGQFARRDRCEERPGNLLPSCSPGQVLDVDMDALRLIGDWPGTDRHLNSLNSGPALLCKLRELLDIRKI